MPRKKSEQPTDKELEILQLLWERGPSPLGQVCEGLRRSRPVATTTVATMLKIMLEKGLVTRTKGEGPAIWKARRSRDATAGGMLHRLMDRVFDGSAPLLISNLLEAGTLTEEERRKIRDLIDSYEAPR